MNVTFKIGQTQLNNSEVKALLNASGESSNLEVDISEYVSPKLFDASRLFKMSVEAKDPTLASLAARFAFEGVSQPKTAKRKWKKGEGICGLPLEGGIQTSEVIERLIKDQSLKAVGAAMILDGLEAYDNRTIRQLAVHSVNQLALRSDTNMNMLCFKGFKKDHEGFLRPVIGGLEGVSERSECYHASPCYTSMRGGTALLKQWGVVEVHKTTEFGSNEKELDGNSKKLRRLVYRVTLTELGKDVVATWADTLDFVAKRWSNCRPRNASLAA